MKNFLTSAAGKIISGIITSAVVSAAVSTAVVMNSGYRTIAVQSFNGVTKIVNEKKTEVAYAGMHLKSGDDVTVTEMADLTLALDEDKYVFAEPKTHFMLEATGKRKDSKTKIRLDEGSELFRIDNKLLDTESFEVETPNSTMSVRGTVFRVSCMRDENGEFVTVVEVFEGEVYTEAVRENGEKTGDFRLVTADECTKIHSNPSISEFVADDEGNIVSDIDYKAIPQGSAEFLGAAIDSGRDLSISKDLLYDYANITPHKFDAKTDYVEPTYDSEGHYYPVCSICGEVYHEPVTVPKLIKTADNDNKGGNNDDKNITDKDDKPSDDKTDNKSDDKTDNKTDDKPNDKPNNDPKDDDKPDDKPGDKTDDVNDDDLDPVPTDIGNKPIPAPSNPCRNGHNYKVTSKKDATCTESGYEISRCSRCNNISRKTYNSLGHNYSETSTSDPTCTSDGSRTTRCSRCGDSYSTSISALGHNYRTDSSRSVSPTCTSEGKDVEVCSRCDDTRETIVSKSSHSYVENTALRVEESCTTSGSRTYTCSNCGNLTTDTVPALGHNPVTTNRAATCTTDGFEKITCSRCSTVISNRVLSRLGHDERTTTQAATCTADGFEKVTCNRCGTVISNTVLTKLGHDNETITEAATCTEDGYEQIKCKVCGNIESTTVIPATGHDYVDDGTGRLKCRHCNKLKDTPSASVVLKAKAVLTGREIRDGEFSFELTPEGGSVPISTVTNNAIGAITFDEMTYTMPGTYTYTMSEKTELGRNITYSTEQYTIKVVVRDDGSGGFIATVTASNKSGESVSTDSLVFKNIYAAGNVLLTNEEAGTTNALQGAEFELHSAGGGTIYAIGSAGFYSYSSTYANTTFVTDADGKLSIKDIPYGTYYFRQTKAPTGYIVSSDISFTINSPGTTVNISCVNAKNTSTTTILREGTDVNGIIKDLTGVAVDEKDTTITAIKKSDTEPSDKTHNIALSGEEPVYVWLEGTDVKWWSNADDIYMNANSSFMFHGFVKVTDINDCTKNWKTDNVENMSGMISSCGQLTSLDLTNFDTGKVTNMSLMFDTCLALSSIDLSNFNTSRVTNMSSMFDSCLALTSVDVSNFNTSSVENMKQMFDNCENLTRLDLSSFDTGNVTDMASMFSSCSKLETIYVSDSFNTGNVSDSSSRFMFLDCTSLKGGKGTAYDAAHIDKTYAVIDGGSSSPGYFTVKNGASSTSAQTQLASGTIINNALQSYISDGARPTEITRVSTAPADMSSDWNSYASGKAVNVSAYENDTPVWMWCEDDKIKFYSASSDIYLSDSPKEMFKNITNLETADLSFIKTDDSKTYNLEQMFMGCSALTGFNLTGWNIGCISFADEMFRECINLEDVDLSGWGTDNLYSVREMFYGCTYLKSIDMPDWFKDVTMSGVSPRYFDRMFKGCTSLTSVDITGWKIVYSYTIGGSITNTGTYSASEMFDGCTSLQSIDIRSLSGIKKADEMFEGCIALKTVNMSGWKMVEGADYNSMFRDCNNLTDVNMTNWEFGELIDKSINLSGMFSSCTSLALVDMSTWTGEGGGANINMSNLFAGCTNLETVKFPAGTFGVIKNASGMFTHCGKLTELINFDNLSIYVANLMFNGCATLTDIDISQIYWYTSSETVDVAVRIGDMFSYCENLSHVKASDQFIQYLKSLPECDNIATVEWIEDSVVFKGKKYKINGNDIEVYNR